MKRKAVFFLCFYKSTNFLLRWYPFVIQRISFITSIRLLSVVGVICWQGDDGFKFIDTTNEPKNKIKIQIKGETIVRWLIEITFIQFAYQNFRQKITNYYHQFAKQESIRNKCMKGKEKNIKQCWLRWGNFCVVQNVKI